MAFDTPIIRLDIDGKKKLQSRFIKEEWEPVEKTEPNIILNNSSVAASGWVDVGISAIDIVNRIVVEAPTLPVSDPQDKVSLRLVVDNGDDPEYNLDYDVQGVNILSFPDEFGGYIKNVQLKTTADYNVSVPVAIVSL